MRRPSRRRAAAVAKVAARLAVTPAPRRRPRGDVRERRSRAVLARLREDLESMKRFSPRRRTRSSRRRRLRPRAGRDGAEAAAQGRTSVRDGEGEDGLRRARAPRADTAARPGRDRMSVSARRRAEGRAGMRTRLCRRGLAGYKAATNAHHAANATTNAANATCTNAIHDDGTNTLTDTRLRLERAQRRAGASLSSRRRLPRASPRNPPRRARFRNVSKTLCANTRRGAVHEQRMREVLEATETKTHELSTALAKALNAARRLRRPIRTSRRWRRRSPSATRRAPNATRVSRPRRFRRRRARRRFEVCGVAGRFEKGTERREPREGGAGGRARIAAAPTTRRRARERRGVSNPTRRWRAGWRASPPRRAPWTTRRRTSGRSCGGTRVQRTTTTLATKETRETSPVSTRRRRRAKRRKRRRVSASLAESLEPLASSSIASARRRRRRRDAPSTEPGGDPFAESVPASAERRR